MFQELADHLPRQAENYLTQTLVAVFNAVPRFRREFLGEFPEIDPSISAQARMASQIVFHDREGHPRLDAKVTAGARDVLALEVKLTASVRHGQLARYKRHLGRLRCPLVVIDAHGNLDELPKPQRRYADAVVSWSRIAQIARTAHRASRNAEERFVLEDWMRFLENSGFVAARPLVSADWRFLRRLACLVSGRGSDESRLDDLPESLSSATTAALRLERHRDDLVSCFPDGWKRFSGMFRYPAGKRLKTDFSVQLEAGLWRHAAKKRARLLYDGSFFLALDLLPVPRLSVVLHRGMKAVHHEYADDPERILFMWSAQQTRRLFEMEFEDAHVKMKPILLHCLRDAMASHEWRDLTGKKASLRVA